MKTITIDLTDTQIMHRVMKHFADQKKRAMGEGEVILNERITVCKYRAEDGSRCAIGCLIPDSEYDPEIEGKSVDTTGLFFFTKASINIASALQNIHDYCTSAESLRESLKSMNQTYNILPPKEFSTLLANITEWN